MRLTSSSAFLRASSSARRLRCSSSAFARASSSMARRLGFLGGALARDFGVAVGVDQGAGARFLLFLGQGAQHDAATAGAAGAGRLGDGAERRGSMPTRGRSRGRAAPPPQLQGAGRGCRRRQRASAARAPARVPPGQALPLRREASRPLHRLLDLDRHRARTPVREFLAHLRRVRLRRRAACACVERVSGLVGLGLFVLFRHVGCCPCSAPARQPAPFSRNPRQRAAPTEIRSMKAPPASSRATAT